MATEPDAVPAAYPLIADMPPPGPARRRRMRAAGLDVSVADFTADERAVRGFPEPAGDKS